MQINPQETVGQLAVALPFAPRVFERHGIDYCCGGQHTLAEACQRAQAPVAAVLQALAAAEQGPPPGGQARAWSRETLTALAAFIVDTHHFFTKQEIGRLEKLLAKVQAAHGARHPELAQLQLLFQQLTQELGPHLLREEQVLFPYIARLEEARQYGLPLPPPPFGTVNNPVRMMRLEHDTAGELLRALRQTANDYAVPADACPSYRALYQALPEFEADLHQHIHLENNLLFPRAIELEAAFQA